MGSTEEFRKKQKSKPDELFKPDPMIEKALVESVIMARRNLQRYQARVKKAEPR